jgi:hypothetical protein
MQLALDGTHTYNPLTGKVTREDTHFMGGRWVFYSPAKGAP